MYPTSDIYQNVQIKINANKNRIVETNFVISCLTFKSSILTLSMTQTIILEC